MRKGISIFMVAAVLIIESCNSTSEKKETTPISLPGVLQYVCVPCGSGCDTLQFGKSGTCAQCNMELVDKSTIVHKNIQPNELCSLDESKTIFLDVRSAEEFNGTAPDKFGAIKNAINIPVQELQARINELEKYKDKDILVYCSHNHRSPRASYILTQNGFKNVTNMSGGMHVWKDVVKEKACNERFYQQQ